MSLTHPVYLKAVIPPVEPGIVEVFLPSMRKELHPVRKQISATFSVAILVFSGRLLLQGKAHRINHPHRHWLIVADGRLVFDLERALLGHVLKAGAGT
jgi:hypothetical protein